MPTCRPYTLRALIVGIAGAAEGAAPCEKLLLEGVEPPPLNVTGPVTVGLPWVVMLPFEWTAAWSMPAVVAPVTVVLESISRSPPVRIALLGLYGAKMYSALIIRIRAFGAVRLGDQPIA